MLRGGGGKAGVVDRGRRRESSEKGGAASCLRWGARETMPAFLEKTRRQRTARGERGEGAKASSFLENQKRRPAEEREEENNSVFGGAWGTCVLLLQRAGAQAARRRERETKARLGGCWDTPGGGKEEEGAGTRLKRGHKKGGRESSKFSVGRGGERGPRRRIQAAGTQMHIAAEKRHAPSWG